MDSLISQVSSVLTSTADCKRALAAVLQQTISVDGSAKAHYRVINGMSFTTVACAMVTADNPNAQTTLTPGEFLRVYDDGEWHLCQVKTLYMCLDTRACFMACRVVRASTCHLPTVFVDDWLRQLT
jgi:hypothetical protein